jgi:hypothetical protein
MFFTYGNIHIKTLTVNPNKNILFRNIGSRSVSCLFSVQKGNIASNKKQEHDCRNWDCSRAVPFLGIFVSNFRYFL